MQRNEVDQYMEPALRTCYQALQGSFDESYDMHISMADLSVRQEVELRHKEKEVHVRLDPAHMGDASDLMDALVVVFTQYVLVDVHRELPETKEAQIAFAHTAERVRRLCEGAVYGFIQSRLEEQMVSDISEAIESGAAEVISEVVLGDDCDCPACRVKREAASKGEEPQVRDVLDLMIADSGYPQYGVRMGVAAYAKLADEVGGESNRSITYAGVQVMPDADLDPRQVDFLYEEPDA